eukprot:gene31494-38899_t
MGVYFSLAADNNGHSYSGLDPEFFNEELGSETCLSKTDNFTVLDIEIFELSTVKDATVDLIMAVISQSTELENFEVEFHEELTNLHQELKVVAQLIGHEIPAVMNLPESTEDLLEETKVLVALLKSAPAFDT